MIDVPFMFHNGRNESEGGMRLTYQAMCFDRPVGPWRANMQRARQDLIALDLATRDEWGRFFIIVPGDIRHAIVYDQARAA